MPRDETIERFERLVSVATAIFMSQGYRRTRMADIARALGVTEAALYRYVESKEALFDLVVRRAAAPDLPGETEALPVETPPSGSTFAFLERALTDGVRIEALEAALDSGTEVSITTDESGGKDPGTGAERGAEDPGTGAALEAEDPEPAAAREAEAGNVAAELEAILRSLYATTCRYRTGLAIVERSAAEWPELAGLWFGDIRRRLIEQLGEYLHRRSTEGRLRPLRNPGASARLILEAVAFFAMHRHQDPFPPHIDDRVAEETLVSDLLHAYLPVPDPGRRSPGSPT